MQIGNNIKKKRQTNITPNIFNFEWLYIYLGDPQYIYSLDSLLSVTANINIAIDIKIDNIP